MRFKKVSFKNAEGHELSGRLDFPLIGKPKAYVLFAHCFTCSKNLKSVDHISQAFSQQGMAILRFDFTGLGQSKGDFADTNFSSNLSDLHDAYRFLEDNYEAPQIMVGHSLGGAAVLHVSGDLEKVRAVATIGAPSTPDHVSHLLDNGRDELEKKGEAEVNIGGRTFKMKKQFLDDLEAKKGKSVIKNLNKSLLVIHSPQDTIVGINNAQEIYLEAMHPKSFVSLDGADHLMTKEGDAKYAGSIIANWASRYIEINKQEEAPEGEVWTRIGDKGYTTEVIAGSHLMVADEPPSVGGDDQGPTPYGYLLSGLGACTAMTLRMYADYKKIPLDEVEVKLTHDKIHKVDGENSESSKGKIDQIKRKIKITGDLTDEQRKRLIEIADRCPVHKTLEGKPEILTEEYE
ncbi:bifunctional alpha/beta hydrolase/OsmC family protein [Ekhidna sp. To15]|uniref:bifunctional alpha/beta hydrolase/OsmC family protein n=1 Tax=Ekhidna sp. To15 TaxID=3395267 RepID=UPI003F524EDD